MIWLVIPTNGKSPYLHGIIDDCELPPEQIVIVRTLPSVPAVPGVWVLDDFGEVNIQRWWNNGIDFAVKMGATKVAVFNDDLTLGPSALTRMAAALDRSGATVCWSGPRMTGWAWMINPAHGVRLDESYRWWFGDDDLASRARSEGKGITTVDAGIVHMTPDVATQASPHLKEIIKEDYALYLSRGGALR